MVLQSHRLCYAIQRDLYEILGVSKNASQDEIKKAFHAEQEQAGFRAFLALIEGGAQVDEPPTITGAACGSPHAAGGNEAPVKYQLIHVYHPYPTSYLRSKRGLNYQDVACFGLLSKHGVDSGDKIRIPKAGNSGGRGLQPGNLIIIIHVVKDPVFQRDGADIYVDSQISFTQAILGGEIEVPTLSGKTKVKIPKGVQHGQLLVLRGREDADIVVSSQTTLGQTSEEADTTSVEPRMPPGQAPTTFITHAFTKLANQLFPAHHGLVPFAKELE
ncbi:hypothetical protein QJS10_CPA06g02161 [Acorus calamus]|uniref:Chaperone DnaJ C-terminal domain-containing protein n=1 Tax=Acorus calamus TaxID=4465 RepID=A0AAV9EP87_ACOCL|nr:hypothetical protein QJS10_CPA06g02161 [Acorus calamus]